MDNVDNQGVNRDIPPLFACEFVDNPVDTVDEYALWQCINRKCEDAYEYLVTNCSAGKANVRQDSLGLCMQTDCIHAGNPAGMEEMAAA